MRNDLQISLVGYSIDRANSCCHNNQVDSADSRQQLAKLVSPRTARLIPSPNEVVNQDDGIVKAEARP
jgi:hypothetical protein